MTVHSAKGLEYKYVYIVGLEENLFPSQRAVESPDGIEEERRLFYVALTRAKVSATIPYAEMRFKWGNMEFSRPSCFLRGDRPPVHRVGRRFRGDASAASARRRRTRGHRRTAPPLRLPLPAETAGGRTFRRRRKRRFWAVTEAAAVPAEVSAVRPTASRVPRVVSRGLRSPGVRRRLPIRRWCRRPGLRPTACAVSACGRRWTAAFPPEVRRR